MNALRLTCRTRIVTIEGLSPNPTLNQTLGPCDAPANMVPPPEKDPKGKDRHKKRSHHEHQRGSREPSGHKDGNSREKRLKQQMVEFLPVTTLANLSALANQGFFIKDFQPDRLINPQMIFDHGRKVLNKSDDAANWKTFGSFLLGLWNWLNIYRGLRMSMP